MEQNAKNYHFIGIGGIGMSGLARILLEKKIGVSGSDLCSNALTRELEQLGAKITHGHCEKSVSKGQTVVYTTGVAETNPEMRAAKEHGCPTLHRSELLALLMKNTTPFAVTGTHGKTTTAALLTAVLKTAEFDPSFALGGMLGERNGKWGGGNYFVLEADESDGSFLQYFPEGAIITNLESEHMEHFETEKALQEAFGQFCDQIQNPHLFVYCGDDFHLKKIAAGRGISYGFSPDCDLIISNFQQKGWQIIFDCAFEGRTYREINLNMIGRYNALNGAAVFGLALRLGIDEKIIREAFAHFGGLRRRCERKNEKNGVLFLDDYGHHPTEISLTIRAIKEAVGDRRLVVVFQPHRYTRTQEHLNKWGMAFEWADRVFISPLYPAGESPIEGITSENLSAKIDQETTVPCSFLASYDELDSFLRPHDVFLTIGAGDITYLHERVFSPRKLSVGILFGGESCEHEISMNSAKFVHASLNRDLYDIHYFGIDKGGNWVSGSAAKRILEQERIVPSTETQHMLSSAICEELKKCELFLPILHGSMGEDGTLPGFFELLGKPYIGPDYRACAITMDKVRTKRLAASAGVPTPKDVAFSYNDWRMKREGILDEIKNTLNLPVYVKGPHLGSSVGTTFVENPSTLAQAIDYAFRFDVEVMVEEGVVNAREIEFAILGDQVPPPGEKLAGGVFVDYEKKYGAQPVETTVDVPLDPTLLEEGRRLALETYKVAGCSVMSRVDFLLDTHGQFWFFEINPIPGMQQFSLFPKIWKREGLSTEQLIDRLIVHALARSTQKKRHFTCSVS